MAINNIPGVGPTNADIATAVAAPSSSTIATAVAAAVPTLTQINNSVATNAPSPNGWVFLGSGNLQGVSSATVSFSAYRKLRIVWKFTNGTGGPQAVLVRFNGDTGNNYTVAALVSYNDTYAQAQTNFLINTDSLRMTYGNLANAGSCIGWMEVNDANSTSAHKQAIYRNMAAMTNLPSNGIGRFDADGIWRNNAAITSVTILGLNGTVFSAGESYNAQGFQVFGAN